MSTRIFKWPLIHSPGSVQSVPASELLSVGVANGQIFVWGHPGNDDQKRLLALIWTGDFAPSDADFLGTVITPDGLVWHAFVKTQ